MEAENNCFWESTNLWKKTLGKDGCDVKELKDSYYNARQNAKYLLDKIMDDFPNLTVHDISHVDALWRVADTIIGPSYPVNPLEGYVLGVAFLIHDAALSYAAVGGIDSLRATVEWQDAYADGRGDIDDEAFKKECDFFAIRSLHALNAETLLKKTFKRSNGTSFFIIDNDSYREHYGEIIGRIAKSHHWDIDKVKRLDTQVNPMADNPVDWEINEQKLACILRCADAGHLDNKRAPDSLYFHRSLSMNGISLLHWTAQNRLGQVKEYNDDSRLLQITSTNSFTKDDFGAWNVAYEAIRVFDEEIKKSNDILKDKFPHQGVYGANSKEVLATKVKARGWLPCDLSVHTSNVKAMIENLGGSKLYGNDNLLLIALRELVQNSRDAVLARRTLDSNYVDGYIKIRLKKDGKRHFIEVEDDGIGMSKDCIKYHLLDFGSSYWKSPLSKYENRGLRSRGFSSVGKFGIGFYSVFMVARSVEVLSRRYESNYCQV